MSFMSFLHGYIHIHVYRPSKTMVIVPDRDILIELPLSQSLLHVQVVPRLPVVHHETRKYYFLLPLWEKVIFAVNASIILLLLLLTQPALRARINKTS